MKHHMKALISILLLLLLPITLISCTGDARSTSLPSGSAVQPPNQAPTNVAAKGSDGKVTLIWTPPPPVNRESYPTSYNLYWSTTTGVTKSSNKVLNVSMPFAHLDLMNGTAYYYRVSAANPAGEGPLSAEVYATPMPPFTKSLTKLVDPDAEVNDQFGYAVAIDGNYAIVGAWMSAVLDVNNPIALAGAAYVFQRDPLTGVWNPQGVKLIAPDAAANGRFGMSVSISGDYVIVGALSDFQGAAYIFHRTGGVGVNTWDAGTKIASPDPGEATSFGWTVSISGDYAVVGDEVRSRVYVYQRTGTNAWDNRTILPLPPDTEATDHFGCSVAISGDYLIVGSYGEDGDADDTRPESGAAYIFHRTGVNEWNQYSKIMPQDGEIDDEFGKKVAISGAYAIVGSASEDCDENHPSWGAGAAYIFHRVDVNFWDEGYKIVAPDAQAFDAFGAAVAISDKYVLVGAYDEDCGWDENTSEGAVYLYEKTGVNAWNAGTKITIPTGDTYDYFGFSVALSGESAIIGAVGDDGDADVGVETGAAYLY
jgi:hypothetical protein